jgi:hypothetical protein
MILSTAIEVLLALGAASVNALSMPVASGLGIYMPGEINSMALGQFDAKIY